MQVLGKTSLPPNEIQRLIGPPSNGMIQDTQLAFVSNTLGITIFILIIAYHFITADSSVTKQEKHE
jgi:hypothetical protein